MMCKTTTATINKLMKQENIPATMYRGKGYYYFIMNEGVVNMSISSIYTYCISDYSPAEIMAEIKENIENY
jgi:hypothetical protein